MPPKRGQTAEKRVLPPFYAFGKLDKKGKIADKKGAAALAKASVKAGNVLLRLLVARGTRLHHAESLSQRWEKGALDIQRTWRAHSRRGIARWQGRALNVKAVVARATVGHIRRAADLQRVWRGHVQRRRVAFGDTPKWHQAAAKLQRLYRGSVTRQLAKQLKYVRCVPAAMMLVAMAVLGDSAALRRRSAGKRREQSRLAPAKPDGERPAGARPASTRPVTQASGMKPPAGPEVPENGEIDASELTGNEMEREVERAQELSQLFLTLTPDKLDLVFTCLDAASQGHIRREEVQKAARSAQLGEFCVDMFFALADINGDGVVDRQEFDDALALVRLFFSGDLRDQNQDTDIVAMAKIKFLREQLEQYNAEVDVLIAQLSALKMKDRVPAIFALSKRDRIRIARVNRGLIQDASVHMDNKEQRRMRMELGDMGGEPDEARDIQASINKLDEDMTFNQYFVLRSPCRQRQLSRAQMAVLQAEKRAADEAARQAQLAQPALLRVAVRRARDVRAADVSLTGGFSSDPYVTLQIGEILKKTRVRKKTLSPEWNENFDLVLHPGLRRESLVVECFDFDKIGSDDSLGHVAIELESLEHNQEVRQWHALQSSQGGAGKGEIELHYRLLVQTSEEAMESARVAALNEAPAMLEVTILRGADLLAADRGGTSDPYVRVQVGEDKKTVRKTSVKNKTLYPEWNQTFKIRLGREHRREMLAFECFDYDVLGGDDSLGNFEIPLESLIMGQENKQWFALQHANGGTKGELQVRTQMIVRNESKTPATLHVAVLCARQLLAADRGGTSDPYVRLHIGESAKDTKKTKVKKKTLSPTWNQKFKFRLLGMQRQEDLTVECFDYDFMNSDDSLGKIKIPIDSLRPNEEYTDWHKLVQNDGSVGEIKLCYRLEEKTAEQIKNEFDALRPGSLTLTVVRARGLMSADSNGLSDPYMQITIGDAVKEAKKTKVLKRTLNPEWNEAFTFELSRAQRQDYMTLECFDWDMLSKNDSLGSVDLPLDALVFNQERVEWHKLEQEGETDHHGEVEVRYVFVPSPDEEDAPSPIPDPPPLVSFTPGAASLEVTVIRAKDLIAADRGGTSDPYVRLHLANDVKKAQKTNVIKKTLAPEWNETFSFAIEASKRRESLTIECLDYDLVGSDDSLGKCAIALAQLAPDHEYTQWYGLGPDDEDNSGQVKVSYKLHLSSPSTISELQPGALSRESSANLGKEASLPVDGMPTQLELEAVSGSEEMRRFEDAKERMMLSSCSLFRLVLHPLSLPSIHDKEKALERIKTIESSRAKALLEIRVAMREADEKFAIAHELLGKGHFQDAARMLNLSQLCYEYADNIEREANVFFDLQSNLVMFDEGAGETIAKTAAIKQLHDTIDIMCKDSMRGVWPLHVAASNGKIGTVSYLINKLGERVDAVDRAGKTALHVAVENGRVDMVRALIEDFGADTSRRTFTGRTPMHIASDSGNSDTVRELFEGCAALIAKQVASGQRARLSKEQIPEEALKMLGTWNDTDHGNSALALAAHKLHEDALEVYALVKGITVPKRPASRHSARSRENKSANDSLKSLDDSLDYPENNSMHSELSMDDEERAAANAKLLRTLDIDDKSTSQNMAPFPASLHWTRAPDLEADLMQEFERKDIERGLRVALRSRPVSASSGSEISIGSASEMSQTSERAAKLAMLRGEFHVRLQLVEARNLRPRKQNIAPCPCVDLDWLPAGHHGEPVRVHERTRILHHTATPAWQAAYEFDVDPDGPDGWSYLTMVIRDVHGDNFFEDFLGTVTLDMSDLVFGVTEGWYELQDNVDLRGNEVFAKNRLRLGKIYPMRPIQGAVYIEMEVTNPVQHLPKPPPLEPMDIFEDEVMAKVMQENRGANKKRRRLIIKDMWDRMLEDNPRAAQTYEEEHASLISSHVERMNDQLLKSCAEGEVVAIHYCIKQGADPNWKDAKNNAALFIAAHCGHYQVADALINYKADVNARSDDGATPLYQAAANGHASVVRRLVTAKADIEAKTNNQTTPLNAAARNGKADGIRALLEEGADVNSRNAMGATALHLAVFASHELCVKELLDHGANTKLTIKKGALAGTAPHEMAKTEEIRELLAAHETTRSGLFGLLSTSTSVNRSSVALTASAE